MFQLSTIAQKKQKKLMIQSSEKCKTDGQTDNSDFMGPSVGGGSKKKNLKITQTPIFHS